MPSTTFSGWSAARDGIMMTGGAADPEVRKLLPASESSSAWYHPISLLEPSRALLLHADGGICARLHFSHGRALCCPGRRMDSAVRRCKQQLPVHQAAC